MKDKNQVEEVKEEATAAYPETEQVAQEKSENGLLVLDSFKEGAAPKIFTTLDLNTIKGKILAAKCMTGGDTQNEDLLTNTFLLQNVFIHEVELVDEETGEMSKAERAVLISPEGKTVAFVSGGVVKGIKNLVALFGMPPWDNPLPVYTKRQKTRRGFYTLNLLVDETKIQE